MDFRQELKNRILVGEGAMGTLLYSHGIDLCYEELNITNPNQIETIHQAYFTVREPILSNRIHMGLIFIS